MDQSPAETFRISSIVQTDRRPDPSKQYVADDNDHHEQPPLSPVRPGDASRSSAPMSISTQETVNVSNVQPRPAPSQQQSTMMHRRKTKQYAVSTRWEREVAEGTLPKDVNAYFCCCARRVGNMFALLSYPDGAPLVLAGPCWPFCVFITLPMVLAIPTLIMYFIVIDDSKFNLPNWILVIYVPCLLFTLAALFCVSCRDPGLMERVTDEEAGEGGWFWNEQVGSFRPPGALYCRECGVLIQDYDHLCPWTGTGIGRGNMLAFKTFVVSVNILCYFTIGVVIWGMLDGLSGKR